MRQDPTGMLDIKVGVSGSADDGVPILIGPIPSARWYDGVLNFVKTTYNKVVTWWALGGSNSTDHILPPVLIITHGYYKGKGKSQKRKTLTCQCVPTEPVIYQSRLANKTYYEGMVIYGEDFNLSLINTVNSIADGELRVLLDLLSFTPDDMPDIHPTEKGAGDWGYQTMELFTFFIHKGKKLKLKPGKGRSGRQGSYAPNRKLPRDKHGNPLPDSEATGAHTQIGTKKGRNGNYTQGREFDANGKPVKDVDFTDHGRTKNHTNPHQHKYIPNKTGGTPKRGVAEPLK